MGTPGSELLSRAIPSFRYTERQQPCSVRGKFQPQLTLLPVPARELETSVMATTLARWEDTGGATICSITTVPSLPLWKTGTHEVLGMGELVRQIPRSALSWVTPSLWKEEEKHDLRAWRGRPCRRFPYSGFLEDEGRNRRSLSKGATSWTPIFFFSLSPASFPSPHTTQIPQQSSVGYSSCRWIAAPCVAVFHVTGLWIRYSAETQLFPAYLTLLSPDTHADTANSTRSHTTIGLFTIRRVSCSQSSPMCKFFTIPFISSGSAFSRETTE